MNLDMKKGLVHVYNKNNYHFDQDSGLSLRFQVTGLGVSKLDFRQRIKELFVGSSFSFVFLLHCFL